MKLFNITQMNVNKYICVNVVIFLYLIERNIAFVSWEKLYRGAEWCEMHPFHGLPLARPHPPALAYIIGVRTGGFARAKESPLLTAYSHHPTLFRELILLTI
jgi:hypothetical protein